MVTGTYVVIIAPLTLGVVVGCSTIIYRHNNDKQKQRNNLKQRNNY